MARRRSSFAVWLQPGGERFCRSTTPQGCSRLPATWSSAPQNELQSLEQAFTTDPKPRVVEMPVYGLTTHSDNKHIASFIVGSIQALGQATDCFQKEFERRCGTMPPRALALVAQQFFDGHAKYAPTDPGAVEITDSRLRWEFRFRKRPFQSRPKLDVLCSAREIAKHSICLSHGVLLGDGVLQQLINSRTRSKQPVMLKQVSFLRKLQDGPDGGWLDSQEECYFLEAGWPNSQTTTAGLDQFYDKESHVQQSALVSFIRFFPQINKLCILRCSVHPKKVGFLYLRHAIPDLRFYLRSEPFDALKALQLLTVDGAYRHLAS
jgi:hypothetical protein